MSAMRIHAEAEILPNPLPHANLFQHPSVAAFLKLEAAWNRL